MIRKLFRLHPMAMVESKLDNLQEVDATVLGGIIGEETSRKLTENPEFLLNPDKMTTQGKMIFYMNLVVAALIVLSIDIRITSPVRFICFESSYALRS